MPLCLCMCFEFDYFVNVNMGKYGKAARKYKTSWELQDWAKGWLCSAVDPNSLTEAFCKICKSHLRSHKADLLKHTATKCHQDRIKMLRPLSLDRGTIDSHLKIIEITNIEKEKDLRLAVYIAMHTAIRSVDHLTDLLRGIGKGTSLEKLKLHRTKCTSLLKNVIAPCLLKDLICELKMVKFSIIVDESTDISINKYLCICVKYFSTARQKICTNFLGIIEVESVTSEALFQSINDYLVEELGLSLQNLIGIGTDGANNLCGKNHSLFTLLKKQNPNLQLVRCICHSLNNASSAAVDEMPAAVDFLCREIYNWFKNSSLRRIEYKRLFDILNNHEKKFHKFVQLSSTRWLARYYAIDIILENWNELKLHFNVVVNKEKCYLARVIKDMLNDSSNILYFKVVKPIVYEINKLNLIFQKNNVEIGNAFDDITQLISILAQKIYKPIFLSSVKEIIGSYDNLLAFLHPEEVDFGIEYQREVEKLEITSTDKYNVQLKCFNYIKKLLGELIKRLPDNLEFFKNIKSLSPKCCLSQVIRYKFKDLPFLNVFAKENDLFMMDVQYSKLMSIDWMEICGEETLNNSLKFWPIVASFKDATDSYAFKELAGFVLTVLSLPSSNATVERSFSIMNAIKTKCRNKIQTPLLSALMRIRIDMYSKEICCKQFQVTPDMLKQFNTNVMYFTTETKGQEGEDDVYNLFETDEVPCISVSDTTVTVCNT